MNSKAKRRIVLILVVVLLTSGIVLIRRGRHTSLASKQSSSRRPLTKDDQKYVDALTVKSKKPEEIFAKYLKPEIVDLPYPPSGVLVKLGQTMNQRAVMKILSMAVDDKGDFWCRDAGGIFADMGSQVQSVVKVDQVNRLITLKQESKPQHLLRWKLDGSGPESFSGADNANTTEFTFRFNGKPVSVMVNGKPFGGKEDECPIPYVVYPDRPLTNGEAWRNVAPGNQANYIDVRVTGYVRIAGLNCVALSCRGVTQNGPVTVATSEKRFVEPVTGITVRSEALMKVNVPKKDQPVQKVPTMKVIQHLEELIES